MAKEETIPRAIWNNQIFAEAPSTEIHRLAGGVHFPPAAVKREFLQPSNSHTRCPWKEKASYYNVVVGDEVNEDVAWYYPEPFALAAHLKNCIAYRHGVQLKD